MDLPFDFLEKVDKKKIKFVLNELYKNCNATKTNNNDSRHDIKINYDMPPKKIHKHNISKK